MCIRDRRDAVAVPRQQIEGVAAAVGEVTHVHAPAHLRRVAHLQEPDRLGLGLDVGAHVVVQDDRDAHRGQAVGALVQTVDEVSPLIVGQAVRLIDVTGLVVPALVAQLGGDDQGAARGLDPVSYTHLDVYKRQALSSRQDHRSGWRNGRRASLRC